MLLRTSAFLLVAALAVPLGAQPMYRCGNTYSQTPCSGNAVAKPLPATAAAEPAPGPAGYALCAGAAPQAAATPEPETARVRSLGPKRTEVIPYAGGSVSAHRYDLEVDAKTAYGVYSGPRVYSCWVSEDQRRILRFAARGG